MTTILAFDTSCDDTAVAIINDDATILAEAVFSQDHIHAPYLGVVPEISSRAHIEEISLTTKMVLAKAKLTPRDIDIVAATLAPGLLGPLLIGVNFAKGFALAHNLPIIGIHHIEGHILAGYGEPNFPPPPFIALIASGGHSALYYADQNYHMKCLGQTLDDAAGEAFDKIGRALGLGYPSGKIIDDMALLGNKDSFTFPKITTPNYDFSFSGLKTHALKIIAEHKPMSKAKLHDFCAGLNETIAKTLCHKTLLALKDYEITSLVIGGGVSANNRLRSMLNEEALAHKLHLFMPEKKYCTDNAVMIAKAALVAFTHKQYSDLHMDAQASLAINDVAQIRNRS